MNADRVRRWRWLSAKSERTCPICLGMDGSEHLVTEQFVSHPSCRCTTVPVLMDGTPAVPAVDGQAYFDGLSEAKKREIVGPVRLQLMREAGLALPDMNTVVNDPTWGPTRKLRSLDDLASRGTVSRESLNRALRDNHVHPRRRSDVA